MPKSKVLTLATAIAASSVWAQSVISAHSGTIQFTEGQVNLNGAAVQQKFGEFPDVKKDGVLATQEGRAEVLLTPGVFLRIGENSSFRMISNDLSNTRLEIQSGEAMIQVGGLLQDNSITVVFQGVDVVVGKNGLYRFDSDANGARLRVYEGEASVSAPTGDGSNPLFVRKGHELVFGAAKLEAKIFDTKAVDEFYRWNARRDQYVAQANIVAAKTARTSGNGFSSVLTPTSVNCPATSIWSCIPNDRPLMGTWAFNPWLGMFTYLPGNGTYWSPFGFGYFSPRAIGYLYGPRSPYYVASGYRTLGTVAGLTKVPAPRPTTASTINRPAGLSGSGGRSGGGGRSSSSSVGSSRSSTTGGSVGGSHAASAGGARH